MADDSSKDKTDEAESSTTATAEPAEEAEKKDEFVFVEDPAFEVNYKGDCAYEVKVTVPVANEKKQSEELFDELKNEAEVPGFRRGRAPRKLLERKFGKAVRGDVETKLVNAAFQKLIKDQSLKPIARPDVEGLDPPAERKDDTPLTFTLKFEVLPRVELAKYRGIEVERPVIKIQEADIDNAVLSIRNRHSIYETLQEGVATEGDQVIISFRGTVDGQEFPGGSAENYPYILGTKRFFPEFEQVLKGSASGDQFECDVTLPENSPREELRGKAAKFSIKVNEVKRRNLPELTDDFAKQAGHDSVEEMRNKVAEDYRQTLETDCTRIAERRALENVMAASKFEIPKTLLQGMAKDYYEDEVRRLLSLRIPMSEIEKNHEALRKRAETDAEREMKEFVTLNEIAEAEGLEITDEDFEQELAAASARIGVTAEVMSKYLEADETRRGPYEDRIRRVKALAVIMQHATIKEKEVTREQLERADEQET